MRGLRAADDAPVRQAARLGDRVPVVLACAAAGGQEGGVILSSVLFAFAVVCFAVGMAKLAFEVVDLLLFWWRGR